MGICDEIRAGAAAVMTHARRVRIDDVSLQALADAIAARPLASAEGDPAHHRRRDDAETLAYVLTLDAVNFGSGWFPFLAKRPGMSGYFTVATSLAERFDAQGAWSAAELRELDGQGMAAVIGQDPSGPDVAELMDLFARALNQLGELLGSRYGGRFEGPLEEAAGSAEALIGILARMPFYDDVASWRGRRIPFYKRAQITSADLDLALGGRGLGAFHDLDRLTIFADNLVPHVLRCEGVLVYDADLASRIDRGVLLRAGSEEETEIRAGGVHAVERLVDALRARGVQTSVRALDYGLWARGQEPAFKSRPRHRARSVFY